MKEEIRRCLMPCLLAVLFVGCKPAPPATSLQQAVQNGNAKLVQQHIIAGTDLNVLDANGWTPVQLAAMKGDLPIVQNLVSAGADLKKTGRSGKTPLELAQTYNRATVVKYLESRKSTVERPLIDGGLGVSRVLEVQ